MSIDTAKLDEIERGLEGVTPGPWCLQGDWRPKAKKVGGWLSTACRRPPPPLFEINPFVGETIKHIANAAHIARCDPQTISELVRLARIGLAAERLHVSAPECPVCEDDTYVCAMTPDRYCGMETAPPKTGGEDEHA